ncbi:TPA: hypothetical protein DDW35_13320 [Candidatus Sumerlaeota bacterium]|nr:hypothetical protein [Candidatus Sumerlaeota bacterium]
MPLPLSSLELLVCYALVASASITWLAIQIAARANLIAHPNERSSHSVPTPQVGGIGICLAALATLYYLPQLFPLRETGPVPLLSVLRKTLMAVIAGGMFLGVVDDRLAISARTKLLGLFLIAILPLWAFHLPLEAFPQLIAKAAGGEIEWGTFGILTPSIVALVSVIWIVGFSNAFNFMDGVNGQSGFFALNALFWYGIVVVQRLNGAFFPDLLYARLGEMPPAFTQETLYFFAILAGAILGFLPFNFPKARTFMGDAGSLPLGASLAVITLYLSQGNITQLIGFCLPLSMYIYDVGYTLVRRSRRGENLVTAHRERLYQRLLIATGWSHARLLVFHLPFYLITGASTLVFFYDTRWDNRFFALMITFVALMVYNLLVLRAEKIRAAVQA